MTKNDVNMLLGVGIIAGWVGTIVYAIDAHKKLNDVAGKLDTSVEDLARKSRIDIPDKVIQDAVMDAADRKYDKAMMDATKTAIQKARNDIDSKITAVVNQEFEAQKSEVAKELRHKINSLDISTIRKQVVEEAKDTAAEKFKSDLDDILKKHNEELESVTKIYSSIAEKMGGIK